MKILIASDTYYPSVNGASYFTQRLATMLAKRGHQVSVIAPSETIKDTKTIREGVTIYGVPSIKVPRIKNFRISPLTFVQRAILRHVQEIKPDIIHIQNHFMIGKGVLKAAQKFNIPIVGTNHFMPENLIHYLHLPRPAEEQMKKFGWRQFLQVYDKLDAVTSPTETAAKLTQKSGLKQKVRAISCGIDLVRFNPRNDGAYLKDRYKIPKDHLIILYVGRLDQEKRIDLMFQAMPEVLKKINKAHLVLAGTGQLRSELEDMAKKMGIEESVTFTGFVPDEDLANLYRMADLFLMAGIAELQSIVTMEAMASGKPVVAVNAVALPELVHDGENGYLFPEDNAPVLADRIIKILSDDKLRQKMGAKSLEIIQYHDINKSMERFEALYKEAIAKHVSKV